MKSIMFKSVPIFYNSFDNGFSQKKLTYNLCPSLKKKKKLNDLSHALRIIKHVKFIFILMIIVEIYNKINWLSYMKNS